MQRDLRTGPRNRTVCRTVTAGVCALCVVIAGCGGSSDTAAPTPSAPAGALTPTPVTDATATGTATPAATEAATASATATRSGGPVNNDIAAGAVTVSGGDLPAELVEAYATNGGDLVDPAEWYGRFGGSVLPRVDGDGVRLVEAKLQVQRRDDGWVRVDEHGWLAMSSEDRDVVVAALAAAAGLTGSADRSNVVEQGADCIVDIYPPDGSGSAWQVQGCSYTQFPGMLALGVSHTGPAAGDPLIVNPTVVALGDDLDGEITYVDVVLEAPGPDGATLHLASHLSIDASVDDATGIVVAGPLRGWQTFPTPDATMLSGPTGESWTLSPTAAVFSWAGRW